MTSEKRILPKLFQEKQRFTEKYKCIKTLTKLPILFEPFFFLIPKGLIIGNFRQTQIQETGRNKLLKE
jgi:hypothetical protein